jgi:hypothetical protein
MLFERHLTVGAIDVPNFVSRLPLRMCPGIAEDSEASSLSVYMMVCSRQSERGFLSLL